MNNILICIGRITKDLELKYTTNNKAVVNIPLAINNGKNDTTFVNVLAYGNTAETVCKYCKKGDLIGAQAIVKNNNWTDTAGNKHYDYSFIANKITFLSTKKENNQTEQTDNTNDPFSDFGDKIEIDNNFLD